MIEPGTAGIIAAAVAAIAAPLVAGAAKSWMNRRRRHVRVTLKSGKRINLEFGPRTTEEEIETKVRNDKQVLAKSREG